MITSNISTQRLSAILDNPKFVIVDIRPSAAYNGWKLEGEARGGHIRGAISFPSTWIKDLSKTKINSLLYSKGITSKKTAVVYGYRDNSIAEVEKSLLDFGIKNVNIYEAGLHEWAANPSLPMDHLTNYEQLVHADWIRDLIEGKDPNEYHLDQFLLIEASWGGYEEYKSGHVPGAIHLDLSSLENPITHNKNSDDKLRDSLLAQGITSKSSIILYSKDPMAAARAASIMMYAGVEDVRILDGGFDAWLKTGNATESKVSQPFPKKKFRKRIPGHPEYIVGINTVKEILANDLGVLVSVRSWNEFTGETSGYEYIRPKGRISGAVWGHSGSDPYHMQDYRNHDNTMRSYHEIGSNWQKAGIAPDDKVIFYCGTGWRASEAFFYAHLMGKKNISVFDGGWYEWSQDKSNPIKLGVPDYLSTRTAFQGGDSR